MKSRLYWLSIFSCLSLSLLCVRVMGGFDLGLGSAAAKKGSELFKKVRAKEAQTKAAASATSLTPGAQAYTSVSTVSLTANWMANGNPAGTMYLVELSTNSFATIVASSQTANVYATFSGLTPDTAYSAMVDAAGGPFTVLGSTTTPPPIIPSVVESRSSGVGPLSVFFDATGTTAAATNKPFHELQYTWNFGDPAGSPVSGTLWGNGSQTATASCSPTPGPGCRNYATSAVAGHVYENIGTFTPSVTIFDGMNTITVMLPAITVSDPNSVFLGKTYCIDNIAGHTAGCVGVEYSTNDFVAAMSTAISAGATRILFNRGDTFTDASQVTITTQGPGLIGAYGTGALPVIQGAFDGTQLVFGAQTFPSVNNCTPPSSCTGGQLADWRVMDLNFIGQATNNADAVGMNGAFNDFTVLRVSMSQQNNAFGNGDTLLEYWNHTGGSCCHAIWADLTIQDSIINNPEVGTPGNTATYGYGAYLSGDRVFFSGNLIDLGGTASHTESHVLRITYTGEAAITNNTLAHPGPTEHDIKLMAPGFPGGLGDQYTQPWCPTGAGCPQVDVAGLGQGYSRWVEMSDNKFISGYDNYMVGIAPQSGNSDERNKDVVIERNQFVSTGQSTVSAALYMDGLDITVRNNTFDMVAPMAPANAIYFTQRTPLGVIPDDLMAYNNSYYSDYANASNNINFLQVDSTSSIVNVENNLVYTPNSTSAAFMYGTPKTGSILTDNSTNSQMMTVNPLYSVTPPVNPFDFKPTSTSYGIGLNNACSGAPCSTSAVPIWTDFFGASRTSPYDMGAVDH